MIEKRFKYRLFYLLLIAKIIAIFTLIFEYATGGYSLGEFSATFAIVLPLFTIYTTLIFKEFSEDPFEKEIEEGVAENAKKVKRILVSSAHIIIPLYGILIASFIALKPTGTLSFTALQTAIAGTESFLGVYIGRLVHVLFKSKK